MQRAEPPAGRAEFLACLTLTMRRYSRPHEHALRPKHEPAKSNARRRSERQVFAQGSLSFGNYSYAAGMQNNTLLPAPHRSDAFLWHMSVYD